MAFEAEGAIHTKAQRDGKNLARLRERGEFVATGNMWLFKSEFVKIGQN